MSGFGKRLERIERASGGKRVIHAWLDLDSDPKVETERLRRKHPGCEIAFYGWMGPIEGDAR